MYYSMNADNTAIEWVSDNEFPGALYAEDGEIVKGFDRVYRFKKDTETDEYKAAKAAAEEEDLLWNLRRHRTIKCFMVVNRGQVWYDSLTDEQKAELKTWYNAWLDVTSTKVEPETPSWIKIE